jgi:uncharacterized damage-inducible protein DinB
MTPTPDRVLAPLPEFTSPEASLYVAQLDDLTRRLREDVREATPEQLAWQAAPGTNTAGMLLAHMAIAEAYWAAMAAERAFVCEKVLGIGADDDGMPLPDGGLPPQGLAGKSAAFYFDLLLEAREYTREAVTPFTAADLAQPIELRRRTGTVPANRHWILYHMVEHFAGHYAQVNLLLHLQRAGVAPVAAPR